MSSKRSVYISDRAESVLGSLPAGESLSGRLNQVLDRYGELMARARRRVLTQFSEAEQLAIRIACQPWATRQEPAGVLIGGIAAELQDAVLPGGDLAGEDVSAVLAKLAALPEVDQIALIEWLESQSARAA